MVSDPERKTAICDAYKVRTGDNTLSASLYYDIQTNLNAIPCKHFDQGRGTCPFGTSCFYRHAYQDGTIEEATIRTATDADGKYDVVPTLQLGAFLT